MAHDCSANLAGVSLTRIPRWAWTAQPWWVVVAVCVFRGGEEAIAAEVKRLAASGETPRDIGDIGNKVHDVVKQGRDYAENVSPVLTGAFKDSWAAKRGRAHHVLAPCGNDGKSRTPRCANRFSSIIADPVPDQLA
jgi:hypothetical protein